MATSWNKTEQRGRRQVIGGLLHVVDGGELDIQSGGALKIGGNTVFSGDDGILSLGGGSATNALIAGAGASGSEIELGTTAGTALDFRFRSSHTSGDARGMYLRLDFDGAGGSGEALRSFVEIENVSVAVGGTVNSHHATLEIDGDDGQVSGAGNVIRATLGGSGTKTLGGTLTGLNLHLDLPSDVTLPSDLPAMRLTKTQDHEWTTFAAFDGIVGSGNAIETSAVTPTGATTHALHITIDGTDAYIPVYAAAAFGN